ncbi:Oidioi.mRNA.OKI2018_I69.XSR.g16955.t1.cds [Oikopleura dioica]|uniref:Oidioi.mRNA.OKI2018_I69.XSR.g16955.t1.cds n=1 Tax=Oikopleura dioica TaxID=34765 RepID=A0ABN7SQ08_OIKDI|nr:Oidioi.mRNA.OKI2018_I69.XSR.g16955.t1.cds [Oikopleura dioica]
MTVEERNLQRRESLPRFQTGDAPNPNGLYAHRYPRMDEGYYRRLASFNNYPSNTNMTKEELAWAGFVWTGRNDEVRCEYCSVVLAQWQIHDVAFSEHCRVSPDCPFILPRRSQPNTPDKRFLYDRRISFNNWTRAHPLPSELADAGFFYTGESDHVKCFHCDLVLHSWEPTGMPWHAHARFSPFCAYVIVEKGIDWIRSVCNMDASQYRNRFLAILAESANDPMSVQAAEDILANLTDDDDSLFGDVGMPTGPVGIPISEELRGRPPEPVKDVDDVPDDKLRQVLSEQLSSQSCKVCLTNRATVVILPCSHLVSCPSCIKKLRDCPLCRAQAERALEIFIT